MCHKELDHWWKAQNDHWSSALYPWGKWTPDKQENRQAKRKTQWKSTFWIYWMKQPVCMSRLLTLICMSWKKIKRVCLINWKSPFDMAAYICKINQYKSNDKAETGFESYSMLISFKWQGIRSQVQERERERFFFFNSSVSRGKVVVYPFSIPQSKMYVSDKKAFCCPQFHISTISPRVCFRPLSPTPEPWTCTGPWFNW